MNRAPEFHLYLFRTNRETCNFRWQRTMNDIETYQVMSCTTDLFRKGYRVFVWYEAPIGNDQYTHKDVEIKLGTCEALGGRELRMSHNLPRLIASSF